MRNLVIIENTIAGSLLHLYFTITNIGFFSTTLNVLNAGAALKQAEALSLNSIFSLLFTF